MKPQHEDTYDAFEDVPNKYFWQIEKLMNVAHLDIGEEHGPAVVDHLLGLGVHVHDHPGGHSNIPHGQTIDTKEENRENTLCLLTCRGTP